MNLHYDDTVETDVYRALRERIGLFTRFVGRLQPILSTLPRGITSVTLVAPREQRERDRAGLVSQITGEVASAERAGFDLDAITEADIEEPKRPEALYDLELLDALIRQPALLPPGVEAKPLAPREYQVSMPGMKEPLRVTTSQEFFDEHSGSTELWSPGSPLFPDLEDVASIEDVKAVGGALAATLLARR